MTSPPLITPQRNGAHRPSLSDQITRLDRMLDGLSEGLNEAVADAVKLSVGDAIRQAVQGVLTEIFTKPEIIAKLRPPVPAAENVVSVAVPERVPLWQKLRACLASLRAACADRVQHLRMATARIMDRMTKRLNLLWTCCQLLSPFKSQLLTAVAVGILVGAGVWMAGAWLGIIAGALGGFATTLCVQLGLWLRQTFGSEVEPTA